MAEKRIITRAEGGIVPLSHTTARVDRPSGIILCHYTGSTGPSVGDGLDDRAHMALLQRQMINNGKTWEYNYIITAPTGVIWEVAGEFQSAHCLNANKISYGVQMNLGVNCPPNQDMVDSWRWLRTELVARGQLTADHAAKPHYWLRDTACCGAMMATPPGGGWPSPTGQGHTGDLLPFMLVPWTNVPGGIVLTPEDKAYLDQKFNDQLNDRRFCWRAPEMANIMQNNARIGAMSAFLDQPTYQAKFVELVVEGIKQAGVSIDPKVITDAIQSALEGVTVPVDAAAIAKAVVDEEHNRLAD